MISSEEEKDEDWNLDGGSNVIADKPPSRDPDDPDFEFPKKKKKKGTVTNYGRSSNNAKIKSKQR